MTPREAIEKFDLQIAEKDGVKGFRVMAKKVSKEQVEILKAMKPEIMAEFNNIKQERIDEQKRVEKEYIGSHTFIRVLLIGVDEFEKRATRIVNVIPGEGRVYVPQYGHEDIWLEYFTPHMETIMEKNKAHECGWSMAYEISAEDESIIIAEQTPAARKIEAATKAAEEKKIEEEKRAEKERLAFEEARETGKPVDLFSWAEDCNDPKEECSTDIVTVYAMPDGTKKTKRIHTW